MKNIKFNRFTDTGVLGAINVKHLAQFFDLFKDGLAASDLPGPNVTPGSGPYLDAWAAILNHSEKLPQPFIQAIQVIENLASPEHRRSLEAAVQQACAAKAPLDPKDSPECLALQIWLWGRYPEQMLLQTDEPKVNATAPQPVAASTPRAEETRRQESYQGGLVTPKSDEGGSTPQSSTMPEPILTPTPLDTGPPDLPQPNVAVPTNNQQSTPQPHVAPKPKSDGGGSTRFHRYKGKIGRLPHQVREQVNLMMYDGLPYALIIEKLGEAGAGLKPYDLTRWKKTGYQDWLQEQQRHALTCAKEQFALKILLEKDSGKVHEASLQVAAANLCQFLADFDTTKLKEKLENDPLNFIRLINALPKLSESGINCESHRVEIVERRAAAKKAKKPMRIGLSDEARRIIEQERFNPPPH